MPRRIWASDWRRPRRCAGPRPRSSCTPRGSSTGRFCSGSSSADMTALDDLLYRHLDRGTAKVLGEALGLRTVGDLLRLYPRRYVERGEVTDLAGLALGED